jgi:hypothetical protein
MTIKPLKLRLTNLYDKGYLSNLTAHDKIEITRQPVDQKF